MAMRERFYRTVDAPMTWTRAIIVGSLIWVAVILLLGQVPSVIIYKFDQYVGPIIEFSKRIPGVNENGLNPTQVAIVRDLVANGFQTTMLAAFLIGAYVWQKKKQKRVGGRTVQDVVKGYMPGK